MKKILCLSVLACIFCLAPYIAEAQSSQGKTKKRTTTTVAKAEAAKPEAKPAAEAAKPAGQPESVTDDVKKSEDSEAEAGDGGAFLGDIGGLGGGADLPFDKMKAAMFDIDPDGMTVLTSNQTHKVYIESKDFNISCENLKMDNKTKMVYATGAPVKLDKGTAIQAFCRDLVYDVEKRRATLENEASIIQDKGGQKVKITADRIIIDNSENKDGKGKPKITLSMRNGSNSSPQIEALPKKGSDSGRKTPKTQKVDSDNVELIKLPGVD